MVRPRLYLIPDAYPRALSAGRGAQGGAALAVSSGLLGVATPAELEGDRRARDRAPARRDVLPQTIVVGARSARSSSPRGSAATSSAAFLFVLGPLAASFVHLVLSPKREYEADRFAAELCGSPHGMADALLRLEQAMGLVAVPGEPRDRAALHGEPVRRRGSRRALQDAPAARRAGAAAARPRPGVAREAAGGLADHEQRARRGRPAKKMGGVLLSREIALRVPSALAGLTSLFGMGRGVSPPL